MIRRENGRRAPPIGGCSNGGARVACHERRLDLGADHQACVGILFSGGPAPAANAVIGAAASAFRRSGAEVIGVRHGYGALMAFDKASRPLVPGEDYQIIADRDLWGLRSARGVLVGTGRANPGKAVRSPADLDDPVKTDRLRRVHEALLDLDIDALVSIGGDDTLRTANVRALRVPAAPPHGRPARPAWSTSPRPSTTTTGASTSPSASSPPWT